MYHDHSRSGSPIIFEDCDWRLISDLNGKVPIKEIAERVGCKPQTLKGKCKARGIELIPRRDAGLRKHIEDYTYVSRRRSCAARTRKNTVVERARKYGYDVRTRSKVAFILSSTSTHNEVENQLKIHGFRIVNTRKL